MPRLLARAAAGRLRRIGDGRNLIDTVYVENAAEAHLLAAAALTPGSPAAGRAYFISQGEPVNCWQWIDALLALAGLPPVRKSMSLRTAWLLGASLEVVYRLFRLRAEPPMTRFLAAQLARRTTSTSAGPARTSATSRASPWPRGCGGWPPVGGRRALRGCSGRGGQVIAAAAISPAPLFRDNCRAGCQFLSPSPQYSAASKSSVSSREWTRDASRVAELHSRVTAGPRGLSPAAILVRHS